MSNVKYDQNEIVSNILEGLSAIGGDDPGVWQLSYLDTSRVAKGVMHVGYFDSPEKLALEAARQTIKPSTRAVYVNLQRIDTECLYRAYNRMLDTARAISGDDVTNYRNFLIDVDRAGVKEISASDAEKEQIRQVIDEIQEFLQGELGWPDPKFKGDSANGYHLNFTVDLPATKDTQELLKRCYQALHQKFGSDTFGIDKSLADPNQLIKLYGTMGRKGDNTEKRPHRWAKLLAQYETEPVTPAQLQELAALYVPEAKPGQVNGQYAGQANGQTSLFWKAETPEAVEAWAKSHDITLGDQTKDGLTCKWRVDCLTSDEHKDGAVLILNENGYLKFKCHHDSCSGKTAHDVLTKYPAPKTVKAAKAPAPVVAAKDVDQLLGAIQAIADDPNLKPDQRFNKIVRDLAGDIGGISQAQRLEVAAALVAADAGFSQTRADQFVRDCAKTAKEQQRQAKAAEAKAQQQAQKSTDRPFIVTRDRQLRDLVSDVLRVVDAYNAEHPRNPAMYINGGRVVRVLRDENDTLSIGAYGKHSAKHAFSRLANFGWLERDDETDETKEKADFPPDDLVGAFLDMGNWPGCPALDGIVNAPTFAKDGTLQTEQGYNNKTRLYYTGGVVLGDTNPFPANVEAAKNLLLDVISEFPFRDEASRANAVAYTILPFVRQMIDGPTPMHLVNSPTPGTGKTKLITVCAYPALGEEVGLTTECEDESEWRKALTSMFLAGSSHFVIDNVNNGLSSGVLASAITKGVHKERILGTNKEPSLKVRTIWAATGNNVLVTDEIARRCALIDLDANEERPEKREDFKYQLPAWAKEHRDELVTAVVTLVKAWLAKGKPRFKGRAKGSFESWTAVIGGILQTAGIPGFLENEDALFDSAVGKNQAFSEFVSAWFEKFGDRPTASSDLFKLASYSDDDNDNRTGEWKNLLADYLGGGKQQSRATKLGNTLAQNKNKVVAGRKVVFAGTLHGYKHWALLDPKAAAAKPATVTTATLGHYSDPAFGKIETVAIDELTPPWEGATDHAVVVPEPAFVDENGVATWEL